MENAHLMTVSSKLSECGETDIEIALIFLETPQAVRHLDECFQNVLVLLYSKRRGTFWRCCYL